MGSSRTLGRHATVTWLRRFALTTPGVISILAVTLVACCVIAGVVCAGELDRRIALHKALLDHSEPVACSAQNLYAALSAADAAAASAFLSGGIETASMRARYQQALADASSALADSIAGATDVASRTAVADISAQLAAYTGLVESARANNRQGFPVGSAYLREASSLMQTSLLPRAEKFYTGTLARVEHDQRAVGSRPAASLVLLVVVLAVIGIGSAVVSARTNRRFNVGLLAAAALVLLAIGWIGVATSLAASDIERSQTDGLARFEKLAMARILAQQARTDETLQLIARGDITVSEKSFGGHINDLVTQLGTGWSAVGDTVTQWTESHHRQVKAYEGGDYPAAIAQAVGADPDASAARFAAVESALRDRIAQARATLRDRVSAAGDWLGWSPTGTLVLMVLAAAAAVVGLWPRLKEFL